MWDEDRRNQGLIDWESNEFFMLFAAVERKYSQLKVLLRSKALGRLAQVSCSHRVAVVLKTFMKQAPLCLYKSEGNEKSLN
jgi:hypothetical protein